MKTHRGFTLIEVMIVVAIVGILAAVAYPSYLEYLKKGRRADAQTFMSDIANRESQYLLDARLYTANFTGANSLNLSLGGWDCTTVVTKCTNAYYDIQAAIPNPDTPTITISYKITGTANGSQQSDGDLTLNDAGGKTRKGQPGW
jgi:type IV pilus assembly protein PilE